MMPLLTRQQIDDLRRVPKALGPASKVPESLLFLGTGAFWVDSAFGVPSSYEDIARLQQLRWARSGNAGTLMMEQYAAESGHWDHLVAELGDDEIDTLDVRDVSAEQARAEIIAYLRDHPNTDAFDLAIALKLEPRSVFTICDALIKEGKLAFAEDTPSD